MSPALEWLVIGGGVHGTHLSRVLSSVTGMGTVRVRVLDPQEHALATFWRVVRTGSG
ncbi:hypothetical protein [Chondromyces crocatus]|uniref:Uncharacterized protein n=1 Tax=Chondromyces crocatus TaxID=52 RepID=A0A0K1EDN1_CHOCO|nr:hypothetical protein [Chondromyces crocatus]AKT38985.1 uncharacterized protein CMC5_031320 [Chondromyces crocatus]